MDDAIKSRDINMPPRVEFFKNSVIRIIDAVQFTYAYNFALYAWIMSQQKVFQLNLYF